jgi:hypothetical protein
LARACPKIRTGLALDEARVILEPYFLAVKEKFMESERVPLVRSVSLEVLDWVHNAPRHFAATEETGRRIVVAPEFAELPEDTVLAILSHEFGHAVDFLYPGDYMVDDSGLVRMPKRPMRAMDERAESAVRARMRVWQRRDKDTVERTADAVAEHFTGRTIGYSGPCELQSFERGTRPRRAGLR